MSKLYKTPIITSIVMLFLALFDLPVGYYTLLRIIVCGTAVYLGFIAKWITKISWVWTLGFIAILFNPFLPIHLDREMWGFIDIIVGFIFFAGIFALSSEGATKSIFKTRAFRIFRNIALVIFLCILVVIVLIFTISGVRNHLRKRAIQRQSFDIKTARPVDGYFIETYSKGEIIIIGNLEDGKENGIWRIYDKYGTLRAEKKYDKGILVDGVKVFDEKGELIRKYPCKEGKISGGIRLDDFENGYVSDIDVAMRETVSFVNMDYEDDNIKAKLLTPYFLTLDNKKYLFFEIDIEVINKIKIINSIELQPDYTVFFRDNFGNHFTVLNLHDINIRSFMTGVNSESPELKRYAGSKTTFTREDLKFGDSRKLIYWTNDELLKNSIYFNIAFNKNMFGNLNRINFVFPDFFIEERTNSNIENR